MNTVIVWSNGSVNRFKQGCLYVTDFINWKHKMHPHLRVVCRYNEPAEVEG
jgi:hypothetical protein